MGSAAEAPVVISSDEEDGAETAAAGKRKSPEDAALAWAEGILDDDDCDDDVVLEGVGYPAMMMEFLDSLKAETGIVVADKEVVVGGNNTRTVPDARAGDDDDDCVILDGDPDKPVAVVKEEGGPSSRDAAEDELQIVAQKGEIACRDFPHPRHLCATLPFSTSSHASHCSMCHCYVCDCPAPCALWDDHCHATDKDGKWKRLRETSKNKIQPNPKRRMPPHLNRSITTGPSSQYSSMAAQNVVLSISLPSAPYSIPRTKVPSNGSKGAQVAPIPRTKVLRNGSKGAQVAPPLYTSSNGNHLQPSVPSYGLVQPAWSHAPQTAQVSPGGCVSAESFQWYPPQFSVGAQYQPPSYPQLPPNTVVGTGVPISRCASLNAQAQGTQGPQVLSKKSLADLARRLGLSDYNTNQALDQQSTSTSQFLHIAQGAQKERRQACANKSYAAATSQIVPSIGHNSSNHAPGRTVLSSGSVQIQQPLRQLTSGTVLPSGSAQIQQPLRQLTSGTVLPSGSAQIQQPLCQLKSQSSVTSSEETAPNILYLPPP